MTSIELFKGIDRPLQSNRLWVFYYYRAMTYISLLTFNLHVACMRIDVSATFLIHYIHHGRLQPLTFVQLLMRSLAFASIYRVSNEISTVFYVLLIFGLCKFVWLLAKFVGIGKQVTCQDRWTVQKKNQWDYLILCGTCVTSNELFIPSHLFAI